MDKALVSYSTARGYVQSLYLQMVNPLRFAGLPDDTPLLLGFNMLAGFAVELYLKAFLYSVGVPEKVLKSASIRHSLIDLAELTAQYGLRSDGLSDIVGALHRDHKDFAFRYMDVNRAYIARRLDLIFAEFSRLDDAVRAAVGAAPISSVPQSVWTVPVEMANWRYPKA